MEKVNFDIISDLIIIKAEINGVSGNFLFDNGFIAYDPVKTPVLSLFKSVRSNSFFNFLAALFI